MSMSPQVRRILLRVTLAAFALLALVCTGAYLTVRGAGAGRCFATPAAVPARRVAMVLGCPKIRHDGSASQEYAGRVRAAAELFRAGRCERILVSSDIDAPAMLADLRAAGVPADRLDCDTLGRRTRDSVVRAKTVYGVTSGIVVSQRYHNERSIYIGEEIGADWVGYDAQDSTGGQLVKSRCREVLARVKAWLERHGPSPA
jgi:SanA protein